MYILAFTYGSSAVSQACFRAQTTEGSNFKKVAVSALKKQD